MGPITKRITFTVVAVFGMIGLLIVVIGLFVGISPKLAGGAALLAVVMFSLCALMFPHLEP